MNNILSIKFPSKFKKVIKIICSFLFLLAFFITAYEKIIDCFLGCPPNQLLATSSITKVQLRFDGTTLVNGKPFFPFGFYHVSWNLAPGERRKALRDIAVAGFNTIHASIKGVDDFDNYEQFSDEAGQLGVYVMSEFSTSSSNLAKTVNKFKQKPTILGWSIVDDIDNGRLSANQVLTIHQQVKAADPQHITYVSGYSNRIEKFAYCSDVMAMQSYPIKVGNSQELGSTYSTISNVRKHKTNGAIYANLQTFNWAAEEPENPRYRQGTRAPNFEEVRNMTYQAILGGAKGIIYYTYQDSDWYLPSAHPELWQKMKSLVPEMNSISSLFLNGYFKKFDLGEENILAGIWQEGKEALVVVINTSYDRSNRVTITLPIEAEQSQLMFEEHPSEMSLTGKKLLVDVAPLKVHVYRLNI